MRPLLVGVGASAAFVIDPAGRLVWSFEHGVPTETDLIARHRGRMLPVATLWAEVDRRISPITPTCP